MTLREYLTKNGIKQTHIARQLGVSDARISQLINGIDNPNLAMMQAIAEITGGEVMPNDWLAVPNTDTAA